MTSFLAHSIRISRAERTSWALNDSLVPAYMVTLVAEADATLMEEVRIREREAGRTTPSFTAFVIRAAAATLQMHPQANRAILGPPLFRKLVQFDSTDISVAVEKELSFLPGQAYAAPIRAPLRKSLAELTLELRGLAGCSEESDTSYRLFMRILRRVPRPLASWLIRFPHWSPSAWLRYRGSAAWVNSPARDGADLVLSTWPWPITFSFGMVRPRPVVREGKVEARLVMPLLMAFDRRIMGGGPASRVLATFRELIEKPDLTPPWPAC